MKKIIFEQMPLGAYTWNSNLYKEKGEPIVSFGIPVSCAGMSPKDGSIIPPDPLYKNNTGHDPCILPIYQPQIYFIEIQAKRPEYVMEEIKRIADLMYSGFDCNSIVLCHWKNNPKKNAISFIPEDYFVTLERSSAWFDGLIFGYKTKSYGFCDYEWEIVYEKL